MAGYELTALVDTGAPCSLMAEDVFLEICDRTNQPVLVKPSGLVCGLGVKVLNIVGETEIRVDSAGPIRVQVARGLAHRLILGCDAIIQGRGKLDYETQHLKWYGQDYTLLWATVTSCPLPLTQEQQSLYVNGLTGCHCQNDAL